VGDPEVEARELWEQGTSRLVAGDLDGAEELFARSLLVIPTAEAYTYRGWAFSFRGRYDQAIRECEKAIETDPTFGNPYNDIGCYLMQRGDLDGAVPWFEKAKTAPRYEPRHFPYLNLGRLRVAKGDIRKAVEEFQGALREHPGDPVAREFLEALGGRMD
jgi:Tfp pilus assembly protein PilF